MFWGRGVKFKKIANDEQDAIWPFLKFEHPTPSLESSHLVWSGKIAVACRQGLFRD